MIRTSSLLMVLLLVLAGVANAQKRTVGAIGFYNLENLFDTTDDPNNPGDDDFLPIGPYEWTEEKYANKKDNLAWVLSTMANGADIVGVCEVENLFVLQDLVAHGPLAKENYQVVHVESPDYRGIDVGLLYKPGRFQLIDFRSIRYSDTTYRTRDMLYVRGLYFGDTLHVFVNHWPSRLGGKADKRSVAAQDQRREVDALLAKNPMAKIVIMGDLNDDPINKSVKKDLRAGNNPDKLGEGDLFNASADIFQQGYGTLMYRGTWNLFDQIIVSQGMLHTAEGISFQPGTFSVYAPDRMRAQTGEGAGGPLRTHSRGVYLNGYSDHFPTYILIQK